MKVAKVITTCFIKRTIRLKSYLNGDPLGFFGHSQIFNSPDEVIDLIKFNISQEKNINPGVKARDLIIVNNDVGNKKGNNFLKKISGIKIPFGKIKVCNRKNIGMSFGAYNYAFKKYRNKYDFFLFTEDDIIIAKENYFRVGIELFKKNNKIGYVAYVHTTKVSKDFDKKLKLKKGRAASCHGAIGLSSNTILNKVYKKHGKLPHYNGNDYDKCITFGEVGFPSAFKELGYKLADLPRELILAIPATDLMKGFKYKKWPTKFEKFIYYLKKKILTHLV